MIRKATLADIPRIAEIETAGCRFAYKDIVSDEILFRDTLVLERIPIISFWIHDGAFTVYVYEDDTNKVVKGIMGIGACSDNDKLRAYELHVLYVDPAFLRHGIGTNLLSYFEASGKSAGFAEFVIWVLKGNEIGKGFYSKNGYTADSSAKIFKRYKMEEIRYIKK
jgi:Acetyltransferases